MLYIVGYIMATAHYDKLEEDRQWMQEYGCVKIVEENDADEKNRPKPMRTVYNTPHEAFPLLCL